MADWTISNSYLAYITNQLFTYPNDTSSILTPGTTINTGWHCIPNFCWKHFCNPKQWAELMIAAEAIMIEGYTINVFNMVPMTSQLAIQRTSTFTAFNNCVYALGYQDNIYETSWETWLDKEITSKHEHNPFWTEGMIKVSGGTNKRYTLPIYQFRTPNVRVVDDRTWSDMTEVGTGLGVFPTTGFPSGVMWNPMFNPGSLMELRPGKNTITYTWNVADCDKGKWFNTDRIYHWHPWVPGGPSHYNRKGTFQLTAQDDPDMLASHQTASGLCYDYSVPNWSDLPICPVGWMWKELQQTLIQRLDSTGGGVHTFEPNMNYPGTEAELFKYPPAQCFIKIVPLIDTNDTNIECWAQIAIQTKLHLKIKKRHSSYYAPTWGPFNWRDVYSAATGDMDFRDSYIRYRTGGMRRGWQNFIGQDDPGDNTQHPHVTPYDTKKLASYGLRPEGHDDTRKLTITVQGDDRTVKAPVPIKRRERHALTAPERPESDMDIEHVSRI
uniref:Capsid protein n=1 Tax=Parvoviridae sp. TaxID=1940570 RepID=A0A7D3UW54_9VIRU|nr:MAG: capsid protein [Parvoviridae sp.]